jgi:signal recognition particle GTPase
LDRETRSRSQGKGISKRTGQELIATPLAAGVRTSNVNLFHPLTGLIVTKLDGTSKGGMVVAIQKELGIPIKFVGLGEKADDLQPFDPKQFAQALFEE